MIEIRNISKKWRGKKETEILKEINFRIEVGQTVGLMGRSGCGKTTLARILLFLEPSDGGEIYYQGQRLSVGDKRQIKQYRRKVQYISQHPESFFDPAWKLGKSVLEAVKIHHLEYPDVNKRIWELLQALKLNEAVFDRYPYQVSGGEIQRAALCRALLLEPELLILDEATSMLDISVQAQILNILKQMQKERDLSYLFISHNADVVYWFSDMILELENGGIKIHKEAGYYL